jgi:hypothetical protein
MDMEAIPVQVTGLLRRWSDDDAQALEQLVPILSNELQRLAHYHLQRERGGHTLQTTALVHDVLSAALQPGDGIIAKGWLCRQLKRKAKAYAAG